MAKKKTRRRQKRRSAITTPAIDLSIRIPRTLATMETHNLMNLCDALDVAIYLAGEPAVVSCAVGDDFDKLDAIVGWLNCNAFRNLAERGRFDAAGGRG